MTNKMKKKVIVAMSGGVDSSVAAALLAEQGHEVIGVTLKLLPRGGQGFGCCGAPEDVALAQRSAEKIGIPHYNLDYAADFEKNVINYFVDSYIQGETPNPCLACNRHIKFDKLKKFAESVDATHLATGHYARVIDESRLFEAIDSTKDQSYVLFNTTKKALESTYFPVGDMAKTEIRQIARKWNLPNADKEDSQEICFVPNKDYRSFITIRAEEAEQEKPLSMTPGLIKNRAGDVVGEHKGVAFYTIGQRSGLQVKSQTPIYVSQLDASTNTLVVGPDEENLSKGLLANDVSWIKGEPPAKEFKALIKIRYKHEPTPAVIHPNGTGMEVLFDIPQRAVSPGQAAVVYRWDEKTNAREVLGGGKIASRQ